MFQAMKQGGVQVITGSVPLSADNVSLVQKTFDQCLSKELPRIVIHLEGVSLIDSAGLELLLDLRDRCLQRGGVLQLSAPNALCRDILQATGVASHFAIFNDVNSAVGSFSQ